MVRKYQHLARASKGYPFSLFAQNAIPDSLSSLLDGSQKDPLAVLSNIAEKEIPLALGVAEVLKFRSLHGDSSQTPESIETFRRALEKLLTEAKTISLQKSPGCSNRIPTREISFAGQKITIPAHYRASIPLAIIDFGPQGEAGTLFPELWASFETDKLPVKAVLTLDGRGVVPTKIKGDQVIFRPRLTENEMLAIGTHTVSITLTDAANRHTSQEWSFTVGARPVPTLPVPDDAVAVATLSFDLSKVVAGAPPGYSLTVLVRETPDGKRFYEYHVRGPEGFFMKSRSLVWVRQCIESKGGRPLIITAPQTHYAFPGNRLTFTGSYSGPGTVTLYWWQFSFDHPATTYIEGPSVTGIIHDRMGGYFYAKVLQTGPDGTPYEAVFEAGWKGVTSLSPFCYFSRDRALSVSDSATGEVKLEGYRGFKLGELKEGVALPIEESGLLTVTTSRWKIVAGNASATIENPLASITRVLFHSPGSAEVVNECRLLFTWGQESYDWTYDPLNLTPYNVQPGSFLLAHVQLAGEPTYLTWPEGIIQGTSRSILLKKLELSVNGEKRVFTQPDHLLLSPPLIIARSELFPASPTLEIAQIMPYVTAKFGTGAEGILPYKNGFETVLEYKADTPFSDPVQCRTLVVVLGSKLSGYAPTAWLPVPAFRSPADLIDVEITPSDPPPLPEGQTLNFKSALVPKPNLGEGRIDKDGGTMNLLDGYEVTSWEPPSWNAILGNDVVQTLPQAWEFPFTSQVNSGTYLIKAATALKAKEKDTGGLADVQGSGQVSVKAVPGLKIKSPRQDLTYPKDWVVKVVTSMDDKQNIWETLTWKVNGEDVKPNTTVPPWTLTLDKIGTWTLDVAQPDPSNPQMELASDTVTFQVKPVSVSITPLRKVVTSIPRQEIALRTIVELEGHQLPKPGDYVEWGSSKWKATVKNVEWKAFTEISGCATLEPDQSNLLEAKTAFTIPGAETALATVTIQVESTKATKKIPPETFILPAIRADLWAVATPVWGRINDQLPQEAFPKEAIAISQRSFDFKTGNFAFEFGTYTWLPTGLSKPVTLQAALKSDPPITATANKVGFAWKGPEAQTSAASRFVPVFRNSAKSTALKLNTNLDFGTAGEIPFTEISIPVKVVPLADLVDVSIEPASFSMPVSTTKDFHCVIKPKLQAKPLSRQGKDDLIYLLDNNYVLSLNSVLWSWTLTGKRREIVSSEFAFTAKDPGNYEIAARANVSAQETVPDNPAPAMNNQLTTGTTGVVYPQLTAEFNKDPVKVGIGTNRTSETPAYPATTPETYPHRLMATITPKDSAADVTFDSSNVARIAVAEVSRTDVGDTTQVVLQVTGVSMTPPASPGGDADIRALLKGSPCKTTKATVLVPAAIHSPHPTFVGIVAGQNKVLDSTTSPGGNVPPGYVRLISIYTTVLTITVEDQLGNTLHAIYGGAPVTENGEPINQTMTLAGTYSDPVGNGWTAAVVPAENPPGTPNPEIAAFLGSPVSPAPSGTAVQNFPVEIEGHLLFPNPAVVNRSVTTSPPNNLKIEWP